MSDKIKSSSLWSDAWVRLRKNKLATASLFLVIFILIACFILRWFLPHDPNFANLEAKFQAPSFKHWLGTDQLGRDLLARILDGGQISLLVAILATIITVFTGVIYGSVAGYIGGWVQNFMMRIVDGLLALPFLVIVILMREMISVWVESGESFFTQSLRMDEDFVRRFANIIPLIFAIAAFGWLSMGRIVCTQAANLVQMEYIEAARSLGLTHWTIVKRHIIPNLLGTVIIYATLTVPSFILYEATLSFIGMGIEPPNSSWGMLIKEGANLIEIHPNLLIFPAIMFSLTLFGFNFLGDGLRDALDPKTAKD